MRWPLLFVVLIVGWANPLGAAQSYRVPFSIVADSVSAQVGSANLGAVTLPLAAFGQSGSCSATFSAELIDGGLELEISGSSVAGCSLIAHLDFVMEAQVPEVGGSVTAVWLNPEVLTPALPSSGTATARWQGNSRNATSSSHPAPIRAGLSQSVVLQSTGILFEDEGEAGLNSWIPGDVIRIPVRATWTLSSQASGTFRIRFEHRVTVPEPSASLSLPLGMAWLAGLSMMRGGV